MTINLEFDSERLRFTPLSQDDLDLSIELWTDPEVTRYTSGTQTEAEVIKEHPLAMRRCGKGCIGVWVLTTKSGNEKIGSAILLPMPIEEDDTNWDLVVGDSIPDCDIEIGYTLKPTVWGKGYATEACKRLLKFAFEASPLQEVVATIDAGNLASRHVLEKSGLIYEGEKIAYGEPNPCFRITRTQWLEKQRLSIQGKAGEE